jgi:hypothetical protein
MTPRYVPESCEMFERVVVGEETLDCERVVVGEETLEMEMAGEELRQASGEEDDT